MQDSFLCEFDNSVPVLRPRFLGPPVLLEALLSYPGINLGHEHVTHTP